jgi:hypothetical protein
MSDLAPKAELLRSLGRLVRGLSALFWGLPLSLLVCVRTAMSEWLRPLGILPPVLTTGLLLYGLLQLACFQKQERIWRNALDRAVLLAIVNIGLAPFIYWWNRLPGVSYYGLGVGVLILSSLLFLFNLNYVLQRLAAMLPDETLRVETTLFGNLNLYLLCTVLFLVGVYFALHEIRALPVVLIQLLQIMELGRQWLLIFLVLLPVAMTMTLIWKIKEVILASVFGEE